jgi:hypothetical protein
MPTVCDHDPSSSLIGVRTDLPLRPTEDGEADEQRVVEANSLGPR